MLATGVVLNLNGDIWDWYRKSLLGEAVHSGVARNAVSILISLKFE